MSFEVTEALKAAETFPENPFGVETVKSCWMSGVPSKPVALVIALPSARHSKPAADDPSVH